MKLQTRRFVLFFLLACAFAFIGSPSRAQEDGINWIGNYKEALKIAKETGKPIFLEFRCEA